MSRPAWSIREAREADAAAILECLAAAFEPYRGLYSDQGFYDTVLTPETIRGRMSEMTVFVSVTESGEVVGTIACKADGEEGHLRGMAVLPERQGCGVSAQLLETAEQHLRDHGCLRITLDTTAPLKRAMRFYERHGYQPSGKVSNFFGMALYEHEKIIR
jgi:GNAT superfamily N-acetyltransferase